MDKNNKPENLDEEIDGIEDDIIELVDDYGKVLSFRLADVTEYKGVKYALLLAAEPDENIDSDEVVIFRLNEAEQTLEPVEDEQLLQEVFDFYQREADDEYSDEENS